MIGVGIKRPSISLLGAIAGRDVTHVSRGIEDCDIGIVGFDLPEHRPILFCPGLVIFQGQIANAFIQLFDARDDTVQKSK